MLDMDVAVIQLTKPVTTITPVPLDLSNKIPSGTATIAGFGRTKSFGNSSPTMQEIQSIPVVRNQVCIDSDETYEKFLRGNMICIGYQDGRQTTCSGDSGSALVQNGVQIGLTSWGYPGCKSYSIHSRVTFYKDWIVDKMNRSENEFSDRDVEVAEETRCAAVGESSELAQGTFCGYWSGSNYTWGYSNSKCKGSTPSKEYPGFHWFKCTPGVLDSVLNLESMIVGNNGMIASTSADVLKQTKEIEESRGSSDADRTSLVGIVAGSVCGTAFVVGTVAYELHKRVLATVSTEQDDDFNKFQVAAASTDV